MYSTKPLSTCRNPSPDRPTQPSDRSCSGYLVTSDIELEEDVEVTCCLGKCTLTREVRRLPFSQDRRFKVLEPQGRGVRFQSLWFIPVVDKPWDSGLYYIIGLDGSHRGKAYACSGEDDVITCWGNSVQEDIIPRQFNPGDEYQQFKLHCNEGSFHATSVAHDGSPPSLLKMERKVYSPESDKLVQLGDASGLKVDLRSRLPDFSFSVSEKSSPSLVVGKWYCPIVFVREEPNFKAKLPAFYEMNLEQRWEQIYPCESATNIGNRVSINTCVQKEAISVFGMEALKETSDQVDAFVWFHIILDGNTGRGKRLGLSSVITEKMRQVQHDGGFLDDGGSEVKIESIEEIPGGVEWKNFACYVLVESFVLRRMDGTMVLNYEFRHNHRIQYKWQ